MSIPLRVLIVEDSEDDTALLVRQLKQGGYEPEFQRVDSVQTLNTALDEHIWDVIIFDYTLPQLNAVEALALVKYKGLDLPFIIVSGHVGEEVAVAAMRTGAHDFLNKRYLFRLVPAITRELGEAQIRKAHKAVEAEAREIQRRLCTLIDNLPCVVYRCAYDRDWTMEYVSEGILEMTGYRPEEIVGNAVLTYESIVLPEDRGKIWEKVQQAVAKTEPYVVEYRIHTKSGQVKWVWEKGKGVPGNNDKPVALEGVIFDITPRKQVEETQKQQVLMKDQFLSHVSHELRTPLNSVYQFVTLLMDGLAGEVSSEQREYLEITFRNIIQLRIMISDLLEVTRAETGKLNIEPHCTYVGGAIAATINSVGKQAAAKGISISAEIPSDLPPVYADPQRIKQILINLIDNGIKFTPEKGNITVQASLYEPDPNFVCVSVSDTGSGIDPEEKERIFDYLYQGKTSPNLSRKGLGIGLYISKELISRQGGRIWVESQPDLGSVFYFTLPVFSLASLLLPVLVENNQLREPVALLAIKLFSPDKPSGVEIGENILRQVWSLLERCIYPYPDRDVLLPKLASDREESTFFIVACADPDGIKVIVHRIQEQLFRSEFLQNVNLAFSIQDHWVEIPLNQKGNRLEELVENVARNIFVLMRNYLSERRGEQYVSQKDLSSGRRPGYAARP